MIKDLVRTFDQVENEIQHDETTSIQTLEDKFSNLMQFLEDVGEPTQLTEVEMMQLGHLMERMQTFKDSLDQKRTDLKASTQDLQRGQKAAKAYGA